MAPREMMAGLMARSMKDDKGCFRLAPLFCCGRQGVVGMINATPPPG